MWNDSGAVTNWVHIGQATKRIQCRGENYRLAPLANANNRRAARQQPLTPSTNLHLVAWLLKQITVKTMHRVGRSASCPVPQLFPVELARNQTLLVPFTPSLAEREAMWKPKGNAKVLLQML